MEHDGVAASERTRGRAGPRRPTSSPRAAASTVTAIPQYVESVGRFWPGGGAATGYTIGPGFEVQPWNSDYGFFQAGDSGRPVLRSDSSGSFYLAGFVSQSDDTRKLCPVSRLPSFKGPCWGGYYSMYADVALSSFQGIHLKIGS